MFTFDISNFLFYIPVMNFDISYRNFPKLNVCSVFHNTAIAEIVSIISAT